MSNRVVAVVPHAGDAIPYDERIRIIETAREMANRLEERLEANSAWVSAESAGWRS